MSLAPGSRLGPYEIVSPLGAGGMGEVFRARDTRLDRSVAIKILPSHTAGDPQVRSRFEREAKTISQLNDPSICTLYDVGSDDGIHYLVMELVEGETLSARIARGPLPVQDVVRYGSQIAAALERAHAAGIVHRDLKPSNVMLTKTGAKLLDFGLARFARPAVTMHDAPTDVLEPITSSGMLVGTLPYMAPEQLQGEDPDPRTDLFALGAVLYEMIAGRRAFTASSSASLIAGILERQPPPLAELNPAIPRALERIVMTCLEKDRAARFQCAGDVARELRAAGDERTVQEPQTHAPGRRRWVPAAIGALLAVIGGTSALLAWRTSRETTPAESLTFTQLTFEKGEETQPFLSPDGTTFVFVKSVAGQRDIFLQRVDGRTAINLTADSKADDSEPAFSPDGSQIAFRSERDGGGIFVMGATGESVRRLTESGFSPDWSPDGKSVLFTSERMAVPHYSYVRSSLYIVTLASGAVRMLYDEDARLPRWSPHGKRIAFFTSLRGGHRDIATIDASGRPESLVSVTDDPSLDWNPMWSPDGSTLYFASDRDGTMNLWQVEIDEETGRTRGAPRPLRAPTGYSGYVSVDRRGQRLLFQSSVRDGEIAMFRVDPARETFDATPISVLRGSLPIYHASPSPDGSLIAFTGGPREDLFVIASDGTGLRQLTDDDTRQRGPGWWPDGSRVTFYANGTGTYQSYAIRPDGSGVATLTATADGSNFPRVSHDQRFLAFISDAAGKSESGRIASMTPGEPVTASEAIPDTAEGPFYPMSWSPDARRIAGGAWGPNPRRLYLFTRGESKPVAVTDEPVRAAAFLDDARILFIEATLRVCILDLRTKTTKVIGTLPALEDMRATSLQIAVGGRYVTNYRARTDSDIWLMTIAR